MPLPNTITMLHRRFPTRNAVVLTVVVAGAAGGSAAEWQSNRPAPTANVQSNAAKAYPGTPNPTRVARPTRLPRVDRVDAQPVSNVRSSRWTGGSSDSQDRFLRSRSSVAAEENARRWIIQANREYRIGAWFSAERSAWEALHWVAESIDSSVKESGESARGPTAQTRLKQAKQAIREARDFLASGFEVDAAAIKRMTQSHRTDVLDDQPLNTVSPEEAADAYLDWARQQLAKIAAESQEGAHAMDLIASILLRRGDIKTLPNATSLCLRRASLQGQPGNVSLARRLASQLESVGLKEEAAWASRHAVTVEGALRPESAQDRIAGRGDTNDRASVAGEPAIRMPEFVELSPQEFARLSQPVVWQKGTRRHSPPKNQTDASLAGAKLKASPTATPEQAEVEPSQPRRLNRLTRFLESIKKIW